MWNGRMLMLKISSFVVTLLVLGTLSLAPAVTAQDETSGQGPAQEAPYLRNPGQEDIFDVQKRSEIDPIRQAAERIADREKEAQGKAGPTVQHIVTLTYDLSGENEAAIVEEAQVRALKSAAARLYFENYLLLGRELLEPYLRRDPAKFIAVCDVLDRRALVDNQMGMTIKVSVDLDALYADMNEKKFIETPKLRPTVAVMLQEIVNGQADDSAGGRGRIEANLEQHLFRSFSDKMRKPALDVDVSVNADLMLDARFEAQRNNIDVLLTGTLVSRPLKNGLVLFDKYYFEEVEVTLRMYRVDDGALIAEEHDQYSAAGDTEADARSSALDFMLNRVTSKMSRQLGQFWNSTILDHSNFRLMVTGVGPEDETMVLNFLKTIDSKVEIFQKAKYGDVVVLNVITESVTPAQMEKLIRESSQPQFDVRKVDDHHYELQVL